MVVKLVVAGGHGGEVEDVAKVRHDPPLEEGVPDIALGGGGNSTATTITLIN